MSQTRKNGRSGLVLLIVLGMIAMFSLLAVTYIVSAGASRDGSREMLKLARGQNFDISGLNKSVLRSLISGTNDQQAPFYQQNLLGDIYGPNAITTKTHAFADTMGNSFLADPIFSVNINAAYTSQVLPEVAMVRVTLNPNLPNGRFLSDMENEYNGRLITFLEGPLTGQTFRILKYVGYVRPATGFTLPQKNDPNLISRIQRAGMAPLEVHTPWTSPTYEDPAAVKLAYSVLIDLREAKGERFPGAFFPPSSSEKKSADLSLVDWIKWQGLGSLLYHPRVNNAGPYVGFNVLINDAAFNHAGIGIDEVASLPEAFNPTNSIPVAGFGNIDSRHLIGLPTSPARRFAVGSVSPADFSQSPFSPAILVDYDYLQSGVMSANVRNGGKRGVDGIGIPRRPIPADRLNYFLPGASNEGYDVPGWQDPWLAHQSFAGGRLVVKPSYHDPAVAQHIAHVFGDPMNMTATDVDEMLTLLDMSSSRVMNYRSVNSQFQSNVPQTSVTIDGYSVMYPPRLSPSFTWSTPPTPPQIAELRSYVLGHVLGPWDIDNDGDGIADSVWIDPNLPPVYAPDGRRLKPLVAILVQDLGGRVNINTAGDRYEALASGFPSASAAFLKSSFLIPSGFGAGPADVSLARFFQSNLTLPTDSSGGVNSFLQSLPNRYSFFDERYGVRRSPFYRRVDYTNPSTDRSPGLRNVNDSRYVTFPYDERDGWQNNSFRLPGLPVGRRSAIGVAQDKMGNPAMVALPGTDASGTSFPNEYVDDPYESMQSGKPLSDDPINFAELEAVLRRFDGDADSLPQRLRNYFKQAGFTNINDFILREVTTKNGELRYPNLAAASQKVSQISGTDYLDINHGASSMQEYIRWLHDQRYRIRSIPPSADDDPELSNVAVSELFAMDFASALKMDINRPLGDGLDNNGNGETDEPFELATSDTESVYTRREIQLGARKPGDTILTPSLTRAGLGSRQILARHLYCLAQLIVPQDHNFPGMPAARSGTGAVIEANRWPRARLRARALAQWAINVVDFRDADSVMTRFEYDIMPFGLGNTFASSVAPPFSASNPPIAQRPGYWAPDHPFDSVNGIENKTYIGVVWGMEAPELVMTESLALHDKRVKDTNIGSTLTTDMGSPDPTFDQYRFPQASLFIEIHNPRSQPSAGTSVIVPGVSPNLYEIVGGVPHLKLDEMAPAGTYGAQPVWRIAISNDYEVMGGTAAAESPFALHTTPAFAAITNQFSFETLPGGVDPRFGASLATATSVEHYLGNGLFYDPSNPAIRQPGGTAVNTTALAGFERFIWMTGVDPTGNVPDIIPAYRTAGLDSASVYNVSSLGASTRLAGGEFLVLAPRGTTPIGSLNHNPMNGTVLPAVIDTTAATWIPPVHAPSYHRITLYEADFHPFAYPSASTSLSVQTRAMNGSVMNPNWRANSKAPKALICTTSPPIDPTVIAPAPNWDVPFIEGIGMNISMPPPADSTAPTNYWFRGKKPIVRLNSKDSMDATTASPFPARTLTMGFGDNDLMGAYLPPDSFADLETATPPGGNVFPDVPFDFGSSNPFIGGAGRFAGGTFPNVRTAYLQRLADPDSAYEPIINPYITVDWLPIDLTVFNGEAPPSPSDTPFSSAAYQFQSRFKNGAFVNGSSVGTRTSGFSYHSPATAPVRDTDPQIPPPTTTMQPFNFESYVTHQLGYDHPVGWMSPAQASGVTLGYANVGYHTTPNTALDVASAVDANVDNGFGIPVDSAIAAYRGATNSLQGVAWYNRIYATPYEIALVPSTGPGNFGLLHSAFGSDERNPFAFLPSFQTANFKVTDSTAIGSTYWSIPDPTAGLPTSHEMAGDWSLLLDFLETKPLFADAHLPLTDTRRDFINVTVPPLSAVNRMTERVLNSTISIPYYTPGDLVPPSPTGPTLAGRFGLVPSYVSEGRINLNTIAFDPSGHSRPLEALEQHYLRGSNIAAPFNILRSGYDPSAPGTNAFIGGVVGQFNPNLPTTFAGAFRPAMSANLAPPVPTVAGTQIMRSRFGLQTSLMRAADLTANSLPTPTAAPPAFNSVVSPGTPPETVNGQPFARFQRQMRLPNLTTNQSNSFAVWVTVSLFEYDPINEFGNEYIGPNGQPIRDRHFYMLDRTIPVGYKPGERVNADNIIVLEKKL